jgi:hypothetical protein
LASGTNVDPKIATNYLLGAFFLGNNSDLPPYIQVWYHVAGLQRESLMSLHSLLTS